MIRAGTIAAQLLAASCAEPQSIPEMLDVIAVRTGETPILCSTRYAVVRLCKAGLLHTARVGSKGGLPSLYTLTPLGERELDRLFMEARL